jgi:hypothetical protein
MTDSDNGDDRISRIGRRPRPGTGDRHTPRFDVISDTESERVKFVPSDSDDGESSSALISVDTDLLVDLVEMR